MSGLKTVNEAAIFRGQEPLVESNPEYAVMYAQANTTIRAINDFAAGLTGYSDADGFVAAVAHGDINNLNTPINHQVANAAISLSWFEADKQHKIPSQEPTAYLGYSQGDFPALAAGIRGRETISIPSHTELYRDVLHLLHFRGNFMAGAAQSGGMSRIMGAGLTPQNLWAVTRDLVGPNYVDLATFLNPALAMVCGTDAGLDIFAQQAAERAKAHKGMKISSVQSLANGVNRIPPAHGILMSSANSSFLPVLGTFLDRHLKNLAPNSFFVFVNPANETVVTTDPAVIAKYLSIQMISSCLMATVIGDVITANINSIREYGHKAQLSKQFPRVAKSLTGASQGIDWESRVVVVNSIDAIKK